MSPKMPALSPPRSQMANMSWGAQIYNELLGALGGNGKDGQLGDAYFFIRNLMLREPGM